MKRMPGVVVGTVASEPDAQGRLVVKFPWLSKTHKSAPAPVATPLARKNRVIKTPGGHELRFEDGDQKKIVLKSNGGHTITLDDDGHSLTVSGAGGANVITIDTQAGTITVNAATTVTVTAPTVAVQASSIGLGQAPAEPAVLGLQLQTYLEALVTIFNTHMHVGELAAGIIPVTPIQPLVPMPAPPPSLLSTTVKEQ